MCHDYAQLVRNAHRAFSPVCDSTTVMMAAGPIQWHKWGPATGVGCASESSNLGVTATPVFAAAPLLDWAIRYAVEESYGIASEGGDLATTFPPACDEFTHAP
ncbi:hypothetical protein VTI28DRAFT_6337 [Corynascus sepedonium]